MGKKGARESIYSISKNNCLLDKEFIHSFIQRKLFGGRVSLIQKLF